MTNSPTLCNTRNSELACTCYDYLVTQRPRLRACYHDDPTFCETILPLGFDGKALRRAYRGYGRMASCPKMGFRAGHIREITRLTAGQRDALLTQLESSGLAERDEYDNWYFKHGVTARGDGRQ